MDKNQESQIWAAEGIKETMGQRNTKMRETEMKNETGNQVEELTETEKEIEK